jgi:uncharacterized protein (TIGR02145 family)
MTEQSVLTLIVPENGNTDISIVDLSGKTVCNISTFLTSGACSFRVTGIRQGIYFVKVTGTNYTCSAKLISQNNLQGEAQIEYITSVNNTTGTRLKSNSISYDMLYNLGDLLLYKGISGQYGTIVTGAPTSNTNVNFAFTRCKDIDGNNYSTVAIGNQLWMADNLKTTRYNDGVAIQLVTDTSWNYLSTPAYCWYDNDELNYKNPYGALYNWYTIFYGLFDNRNLCPTNFHLPTDAEWTILTDFLGGNEVAGGKMKSTGTLNSLDGYWYAPNTGATDESGFIALPGGFRYDGQYSIFSDMGYYGHWWTATDFSNHDADDVYLSANYIPVGRFNELKSTGESIRCVRNNY